MTILVFLIVLTILVLVHELGHFLVAKKFGIKVEEFGFGFPPRLFGIKKGETIYSINWLPIGGFVKLYGEDEAGGGKIGKLKVAPRSGIPLSGKSGKLKVSDRSRAFFARPPWQRALVAVAGVVMNFVLAVIVFSFFYTLGVKTQEPLGFVEVKAVNESSPADVVGIKPGDIVVSIDGIPIKTSQELVTKTREKLGEVRNLEVKRGIEYQTFQVIPRTESPEGEGPIGIVLNDTRVLEKKYPIYQAPIVATRDAFEFAWLIIKSLSLIFWQFVTLGKVPQDIAGPVGIAQITGEFAQFGPMALLSFLAFLSLNLAVLNILPIPALDGGRLFFILIEVIFRKRVSPHFERHAHAIGLAILLALLLLITFRDINRILQGQSILPQ